MARLSFIIPVRDQARFVSLAVASALGQSFADLEVVVIDDASCDATPSLLAAIPDPRLNILRNDKPRGPGGARNRGIDAASGDFIAFLDSDDLAHPGRALRQVEFLEAHPDHVIVGSAYRVIDDEGVASHVERPSEAEDGPIRWTSLFFCPFHLTTTMVRARALKGTVVRFPENARIGEDFAFFSALLKQGKGANLADVLTDYRRHGAMTSKAFESEGWGVFAEVAAANIRDLGLACDGAMAARLAAVHAAKLSGQTAPGDEMEGLVWQLYQSLKEIFDQRQAG
jgi:glycosyltransferase involved in cell wall biosynthesis